MSVLELGGERINTQTMSCKAGLDWEELGDCQELGRCAGRVGRALLRELGQEARLGFWNLSLPASSPAAMGKVGKKALACF